MKGKSMSISDLRVSAEQIGKLYPVLVDNYGEIIDGQHRLKADPQWPIVKLENIKTDEQKFIARLVTNVCRREVSASEKKEILDKLAHLYLKQGIEQNKIVQRIVGRTGMSYRWVMMYLPDNLKQRPGLGGPSKSSNFAKSANTISNCKVANLATPNQYDDGLLTLRKTPIVTIKKYANSGFVGLLLERETYMKLEKFAESHKVEAAMVITNALLLALELIKRGYADGHPRVFQY
jgi:hypothetical protein